MDSAGGWAGTPPEPGLCLTVLPRPGLARAWPEGGVPGLGPDCQNCWGKAGAKLSAGLSRGCSIPSATCGVSQPGRGLHCGEGPGKGRAARLGRRGSLSRRVRKGKGMIRFEWRHPDAGRHHTVLALQATGVLDHIDVALEYACAARGAKPGGARRGPLTPHRCIATRRNR